MVTRLDELETPSDDYLEMFTCGATNFCEFFDEEELPDMRRGGAAMRTKNDNATESMLTIQQACKLLSVHANTLRRWSANGLLKEYRIGPGSHRRYKVEDIVELIEAS